MQGTAFKFTEDWEVDNQGVLYLHAAKHSAVSGWLPFFNKAADKSLHQRFDVLLNRELTGKFSSFKRPCKNDSNAGALPLQRAAPAYTYAFQGSGLLVQQAVSSVAGCSLRTAPHVAATSSAAIALTGYLSNLEDLVERLALSDGVALGSSGSNQGSVAAEALLQMFTRSTFNPLVLLSELQGQFAFAAYDADRKQVFAARDPSGKEPLFYSFGEDGGVSFANNALSVPGLEETWHALLPGHYVCGRNPREAQQFALTPDQLTRLSLREAAEDDCLSSGCLSSASTPRHRSPLANGAPHLATFSLREALSDHRSSSLRSSTEMDPRARNMLLGTSL